MSLRLVKDSWVFTSFLASPEQRSGRTRPWVPGLSPLWRSHLNSCTCNGTSGGWAPCQPAGWSTTWTLEPGWTLSYGRVVQWPGWYLWNQMTQLGNDYCRNFNNRAWYKGVISEKRTQHPGGIQVHYLLNIRSVLYHWAQTAVESYRHGWMHNWSLEAKQI